MTKSETKAALRRLLALITAVLLCAGLIPAGAFADGDIYVVSVNTVNMRQKATTDSSVVTTIQKGESVEVSGSEGDWYKVTYKSYTGYIRNDMLKKGNSSSEPDDSSATATVTGNSVFVRKSPSSDGAVIDKVTKGTVLPAISYSNGWVKVTYRNQTGYISADYVNVKGLSVPDSSRDELVEMTATGKVTASGLMVRKSATTSADSIDKLEKNDKVKITGKKGDWYRVKVSAGTGYVLAQYVTIVDDGSSDDDDSSSDYKVTEMTGSGKISATTVNVRKTPSTSAQLLYQLDKGNKVDITGKSGDWYRIHTSKGTGFVLGQYVTDVSATEPNTTLRYGMNGQAVKEMQNRLKELGYLSGTADGDFGDKTLTAVKNFQSRAGLTADGIAGPTTLKKLYSSDAPKAGSEPTEAPTATPAPTEAPTYTTLRQGSKGDAVKTLQQRLIKLGYLTGTADGDFGAKTTAAVKAFQIKCGLQADGVAGAATQRRMYADDAPMSDGNPLPTTKPTAEPTPTPAPAEYTTLRTGSTGEAVQRLQSRLKELGYLSGSADGNFGSATANAVKAFQKKANLTVDGVAGPATQKAIFASNAPKNGDDDDSSDDDSTDQNSITSTLRVGSSGAEVKILQTRLKSLGYLSGSADGQFGTGTMKAVMLFQKQGGLTVDGVAGPITVKKMFSSSAEKYDGKTTLDDDEYTTGTHKVYNVDWWTGGIQDIFTRGTIATVTDVKTGLTWQVKRRGGTNHADVEPTTAEGVAKMKICYNGTWSWTRHAIWVTINGKTYAASMNGMPHGNYSITDNNFPGHHCIHFLNSRTHSGNRLDADHQACVRQAYEVGNR